VHSILELMLRNAPLCKHEVALLVARAENFGNWYPTTLDFYMDESGQYPGESVTPKFHRLVSRVPEFARQWERWAINIGQMSECATEHTHGVIGNFFRDRDHLQPAEQAASTMAAVVGYQTPMANMVQPRHCIACNAPYAGVTGTHECAKRRRR